MAYCGIDTGLLVNCWLETALEAALGIADRMTDPDSIGKSLLDGDFPLVHNTGVYMDRLGQLEVGVALYKELLPR